MVKSLKGTKVCSQNLGHMTKMASTSIYGKKHSKIFRTCRRIFTKIGMINLGLQPIIV